VRFGSGRFLLAAAEVYLSTAITYAEKGMSIAMSIPATMRALQQTFLNGPQDMRLITDAPVPSPGAGEVLIRVAVVYGVAGGEASITNWELVYEHQVQVIGFNVGVLIQAAPQIVGEVMGELSALIAAGVLTPGRPTAYELADGPKTLAELEARATIGKLALLP
jgi:NADPH:quinone reductase-like Zn-dependent oxidoreductase